MLLRKERWWKEREEDPPKRTSVDQSTMPDKRLSSFVTSNTKNFFQVLAIPDSFLATDQDTWLSNSDYMVVEDIVRDCHCESFVL